LESPFPRRQMLLMRVRLVVSHELLKCVSRLNKEGEVIVKYISCSSWLWPVRGHVFVPLNGFHGMAWEEVTFCFSKCMLAPLKGSEVSLRDIYRFLVYWSFY
jgi:hypothetical protein